MNSQDRHSVIIVEPSEIISKGLHKILTDASTSINLIKTNSIDGLKNIIQNKDDGIVILNTSTCNLSIHTLKSLKNQFNKISWIGLQTAYLDNSLAIEFDAIIQINDNAETILSILNKIRSEFDVNSIQSIPLSDRENDVIKLLVKGSSNKEIADLLNISIHTVNTHRKNITQKTGIKSLAGLTIYAVSKKIISIEEYKFKLPTFDD